MLHQPLAFRGCPLLTKLYKLSQRTILSIIGENTHKPRHHLPPNFTD